MDGHCFGYPLRRALTAAALVFTVIGAAPAAAEEPTPQWLSVIGDFVRDGLAPPRIAEDVLREEPKAERPSPAPEPVRVAPPPVYIAPPPPVHVAAPQPVAEPAPPPVETAPVMAAEPVAEPAKPVKPPVKPDAARKPDPSVQPSPRAAVVPAEIKPRPMVPVAVRPVQPPPPEPLTGSRIAATASLDQAIKLGGPASLYGQRVKKPQTAQ